MLLYWSSDLKGHKIKYSRLISIAGNMKWIRAVICRQQLQLYVYSMRSYWQIYQKSFCFLMFQNFILNLSLLKNNISTYILQIFANKIIHNYPGPLQTTKLPAQGVAHDQVCSHIRHWTTSYMKATLPVIGNTIVALWPLRLLSSRLVMSPYLGGARAFLSSLERQPSKACRDYSWSSAAGQPRQSHAGRQRPRRHGWGEAWPRRAERITELGGVGEEDVLKDVSGVGVGKEGICSPFQFMFGSLCSTDHSNR